MVEVVCILILRLEVFLDIFSFVVYITVDLVLLVNFFFLVLSKGHAEKLVMFDQVVMISRGQIT